MAMEQAQLRAERDSLKKAVDKATKGIQFWDSLQYIHFYSIKYGTHFQTYVSFDAHFTNKYLFN